MRVIRNPQDWRAVAFVAAALAMLLAPYAWPVPAWLAPLWIALSTLLCFSASIINHNHMHRSVFSDAPLNRGLNVALTLARGHSASGIVAPHNLNHHVLVGSPEDWIDTRLAGHGLGWVRLARYILAASLNMAVQRRRHGAPGPEGHATERVALALAIAAGVLVDWRVALLFNMLPWLAGLAMLVGVNLLQHDACDPRVPFGESRNFVGALGNWFLFNNGFHAAHHFEPERHWSELPALHARLRDRLPVDLEQSSILGYLWRFGWRQSWAHDAREAANG